MKHVKKNLIALLGLVLMVSVGCQDKPPKEDHKKNHEDEKGKMPQVPEVKPPDDIVTLEEAKSIYDNYSKFRVNLIHDFETQVRAPEEKFIPARFVDFDYETIKQYIAYVDQEAAKAGVKKVTKLRMYFANYPEEEKFPDGKAVMYPRQNSIFILPTLDVNGENAGFYIGKDGKAELIQKWTETMQKEMGLAEQKNQKALAGFAPNFSLAPPLYNGGSLTLNYGSGGPPPKADF
ncbi:MAG: hypothetical protein AAGB24_09175 [Bacteroidota bacterium]